MSTFLAVLSIFVSFVQARLVPQTVADLNMLHIAIWSPVVVGLMALTGQTIKRLTPARRPAPARSAPATSPAPAHGPKLSRRTQRELDTALRTADQHYKARVKKKPTDLKTADRARSRAYVNAYRHAGLLPSEEEERATHARQAAEQKAAAAEARTQRQAAAQAAAQERAQLAEQKKAQLAEARAQRAQLVEQKRAAAAEARAQRQAAAQAAAQERAQRAEARAAATAERATNRAARAAAGPRRRTAAPAQRDPTSRAFGTDPNRVYDFRFRVVDLDQLITSNTDSGAVNPAYDQHLQPRQRNRVASQHQIDQVARSLVPESLLWDFHQLDKGAPIIGPDRMVESGNGRALALRRARAEHPQQWANYQKKLRENLAGVGLDESDAAGIASPVLVRERISDVNRVAFAREANAAPVLQMSTLENAIIDSKRISDPMVLRFTVKEDQSVDLALRARSNAGFVREFVDTLPENERATLMRKDGSLNQMGIWRIKGALFARVFPGEAGERIAETFLESLDSTTKNFENAISATLPALARAESLIANGERAADLSLAADMSKALDMLARLKEQELEPHVYVEQSSMFGRELTPTQERLLLHFEQIGRTPKQIRAFLNAYAGAVESANHPDQIGMFGSTDVSKDRFLDSIISTSQPQPKAKAA